MMTQEILACFSKKNQWKLKELEAFLQLKSTKDFINLIKTLNELEEEKIIFNNHSTYVLIDYKTYFYGKIKDVSKYEYALIAPEHKIYISKRGLPLLMNQDEVLISIQGTKIKVLKVFSRGTSTLAGVVYKRKNRWLFYSDVDYHCSFDLINVSDFSLRNNDRVIVDIIQYDLPLKVKITHVLSSKHTVGMDITSLLYENHVRQTFDDKVKKETDQIPNFVSKKDLKNRKDLRNLLTFTIDGDDARDFDDAISIQKTDQGYKLYVHIADVSYYVPENSAIDREAYTRSTSIYVVDRVIPMLPFELSNGICSLNPHVDRCTITCEISLSDSGAVVSSQVYPSIIHSDMRCTYKNVNSFLNGENNLYQEISEPLYWLQELTHLLQAHSKERGVIDFATKEVKISLNQKGYTQDIQIKERGFSEQMIEECMILANVQVASLLHQKGFPGMYRVHEIPDPKKISVLVNTAKHLHEHVDFDPNEVQAKELQQFLEGIKNPDHHMILSLLALRCMQKARYSQDCIGHYGLALDEYCHFTSPIRRYSDLVVHRMLRKYLFQGYQEKSINKDFKKIEKQSFYVSQKERDAIYVERVVDDYKKAEYMENKIGNSFTGMIVGVLNFGFFVELDNTVEGLVPIRSLYDDYYTYDEDLMILKAENLNKVYQVGDKVKVRCSEVNKQKGQVTFEVI